MGIRDVATELGVDPDHAEATQEAESRGNAAAVSTKGAQGSMQVMPATGAEMAKKVGPDKDRQGAAYLGQMYGQFNDWPLAHAAYNAGPNRVRHAQARTKKAGGDPQNFSHVARYLPAETRKYVPDVMSRAQQAHTRVQMPAAQGTVTADSDLIQPEDYSDDLIKPTDYAGTEPAGADVSGQAKGPSLGETAQEYIPGGRGLVDLAKIAGHVTGLRHMTEDEWREMAARGESQREHPIATALGAAGDIAGVAVPALRPLTAASSAVGGGVEQATGSRTAGHLAQLATSAAPAVGTVARGARALVGGEDVAQQLTRELGAGTSAKEAGLQLQREGAPGAIEQTTDEASRLYQSAQEAARAGGVGTPPGGGGLVAAERSLRADTKAAGGALPGPARRSVKRIMNLIQGPRQRPSGLVTPGPGGGAAGARPVAAPPRAQLSAGVDDLIEEQSNLRRIRRGLGDQHPAAGPLSAFDDALEAEITAASQGSPETMAALGRARQRYAQTTVPTRRTAGVITRAETPEAATAAVTRGVNAPGRLGRIARVEPEAAEAARSASLGDLIEASGGEDGLDLVKMSRKIAAMRQEGTLRSVADTPARQRVLQAVRQAAKMQKSFRRAPMVGSIAGGTGGGWAGLGAGYTIGRVVKAASESEFASRAFLRMAQARPGTPGFTMARQALQRALGRGAAGAVRTAPRLFTEKEGDE